MTTTLYRALAGRLAVMAIAGLTLGGIAVDAATSRPAEVRTGAVSCFDPAAPDRGWISCEAEAPVIPAGR